MQRLFSMGSPNDRSIVRRSVEIPYPLARPSQRYQATIPHIPATRIPSLVPLHHIVSDNGLYGHTVRQCYYAIVTISCYG